MPRYVARSVAWPTADLSRLQVPLAIALIASLHVYLAANHVPGRDELQAWLIALSSHDLPSLVRNLRNEGHPPLFHGLLLAVQQITGARDLWLLSATAVVLAVSTAALILCRAPFPLWLRVALTLNGLLLFEYGVLARSYALGTLLVVAVCCLRAHPSAWLLLAAMPHVSIHFGMLAGVLALLRLLDDDRSGRGLVAVALVAASGLLSLWLMWPAPDTVPAVVRTDLAGAIITSFVNLGSLLVPVSSFGGAAFWSTREWIPVNIVGAVASLAMIPLLLRHNRDAHRLWWLLLLALSVFSVTVFLCFARHFGVLLLLVIVVAWRDWHLAIYPKRLFAGMTTWLAGMGLVLAWASANIPFSQSDKATAWIVRHQLARQPWTAWPPHAVIEYTARLDVPLIDLAKGCKAMFPSWTYADIPEVDDVRFAELLRARVAAAGGTLYLALWHARPLPVIVGLKAEPLYRDDGGAYAQAQTIYRLEGRSQPAAIPPC